MTDTSIPSFDAAEQTISLECNQRCEDYQSSEHAI